MKRSVKIGALFLSLLLASCTVVGCNRGKGNQTTDPWNTTSGLPDDMEVIPEDITKTLFSMNEWTGKKARMRAARPFSRPISSR